MADRAMLKPGNPLLLADLAIAATRRAPELDARLAPALSYCQRRLWERQAKHAERLMLKYARHFEQAPDANRSTLRNIEA